jgi:hypothetical protein
MLKSSGAIKKLLRIALQHLRNSLFADFESYRDVFHRAGKLDPDRMRDLGRGALERELDDGTVENTAAWNPETGLYEFLPPINVRQSRERFAKESISCELSSSDKLKLRRVN